MEMHCVLQGDDTWEVEACNKVDDLLESFMGIRDTELGKYNVLYVCVHGHQCLIELTALLQTDLINFKCSVLLFLY